MRFSRTGEFWRIKNNLHLIQMIKFNKNNHVFTNGMKYANQRSKYRFITEKNLSPLFRIFTYPLNYIKFWFCIISCLERCPVKMQTLFSLLAKFTYPLLEKWDCLFYVKLKKQERALISTPSWKHNYFCFIWYFVLKQNFIWI